MEFTSKARFMRVSPQKARLVLDMIKGRRAEDALATLAFTKKGVAPDIHKLLRSAIENANYLGQEKGLDVDVDDLYVKNAIANEGPRLKRIRPAPQGRAFRYQRRMSHMEITLAQRHGTSDVATAVSDEKAPATRGGLAGRSAGKTTSKTAASNKTAKLKQAHPRGKRGS